MKINSFNFFKNNSKIYKNNLRKCSEIFKNLFSIKENFFFNTLSEQYQKNLFLKKIILKKKLHKNILKRFGDKVIQSKSPRIGYAPEVSICTSFWIACIASHKVSRGYMAGSPPVITTMGLS